MVDKKHALLFEGYTPENIPPGVYDGMPIEFYHKIGGVISKSGLDLIDRSPYHYKKGFSPTTATLLKGGLFHKMVLEPHLIGESYIIDSGINRRTKAGKKELKDLEKEAEEKGKVVIRQKDIDDITPWVQAVKDHAQAKAFLSSGIVERTFIWQDAETGVVCRCRPDYFRRNVAALDLKSARGAREDEFIKASAQYRYYVQDWFYREGMAACDHKVGDFVFVVLENKWPFAVGCYKLDQGFYEQGRFEARKNLRTYADCLSSGIWPQYTRTITTLAAPKWLVK